MFKYTVFITTALISIVCRAEILTPTPEVKLEFIRPTPTCLGFNYCEGQTCRLLGRGIYRERELRQVAALDPEALSTLPDWLNLPRSAQVFMVPVALGIGILAGAGIDHMAKTTFTLVDSSMAAGIMAMSAYGLSPIWAPLLRRYRYARASSDKEAMIQMLNRDVALPVRKFKKFIRRFEGTLRRVDAEHFCEVDLQEPKIVVLPFKNLSEQRR